MRWNTLSKDESKKTMEGWSGVPLEALDVDNYQDEEMLRQAIKNCMDEALRELEVSETEISKNVYRFDLMFGLKLFEYMQGHTDMNSKRASDLGIWRYISIKVVPDIVYRRWGDNPSRYWKSPRRIWLKSLWWYIYLSWQGSIESTYEVLKNNSTDEVVQLTERIGRFGYRVKLYRAIMKEYGSLDRDIKKRNGQIFRKVMKLNTARASVIEPGLMDGGEDQYARNLFEYFIGKQ